MTAGSLRVRVVQPGTVPNTHEDALAMVGSLLADCSEIDLLVLPELALCGYGDAKRIRRLATDADSAFIMALRERVHACGTGLIAGHAIRDGDKRYNCAIAIRPYHSPDVIYRKVNLWGDHENVLFEPGAPSPVFEWNGLTLGMLICHDLDHAPTAADLVARGANVIVALSATNHRYRIIAERLVPARAYENVSYVIYADTAGHDGEFSFLGYSRVLGPDGEILASTGPEPAKRADAVLSLATVREWRRKHPYVRTGD